MKIKLLLKTDLNPCDFDQNTRNFIYGEKWSIILSRRKWSLSWRKMIFNTEKNDRSIADRIFDRSVIVVYSKSRGMSQIWLINVRQFMREYRKLWHVNCLLLKLRGNYNVIKTALIDKFWLAIRFGFCFVFKQSHFKG